MTHFKKITRRQFLGRGAAFSAAGLAWPFLLPGRAFGANDTIGVGYIGVGRRARQLMDLPRDMRIVAFSDVNPAHLNEMTAKHKDTKAYGDYREMLQDPAVDAVIIATPDHWHAINAVHACEAGKDVYVEKPMTLTIREGRIMVDAARKYDRVVQVGSQQRSMKECRFGCELIRNGRIGKVHTVHTANYESPWECDLPEQPVPEGLNWDMWCGQTEPRPYHEELYLPRVRGQEAGWISFRPYSGGEMTGWGAHGLDIIQWALGYEESCPVEVWPELDKTPPFDGVHKGPTCQVGFRYENGTTVMLDGQGPAGGGLFEGEDGKIRIDRGKWEADPKSCGEIDANKLDVRLYQSDDHFGNWLECIRNRKRPVADVEIGHRTTTMCHLGNIARWTGRKLRWDPVKESFVDDPEANTYLERPMRAPWTF